MTGYKTWKNSLESFFSAETQSDREVIIWLNLSQTLLVTRERWGWRTKWVWALSEDDRQPFSWHLYFYFLLSPWTTELTQTLKILCGTLREDMDKETHPASIVAAGRDLRVHLISEFVSSREMSLFSPLCSCWSVKWASSGPPRPDSSLPCCLPPRCCQRRTAFLQCQRSTQRRVAHTVLSAHRMYLCYTHRYYSRSFRGETLDRLRRVHAQTVTHILTNVH